MSPAITAQIETEKARLASAIADVLSNSSLAPLTKAYLIMELGIARDLARKLVGL